MKERRVGFSRALEKYQGRYFFPSALLAASLVTRTREPLVAGAGGGNGREEKCDTEGPVALFLIYGTP